jgi:hypothetical protein
MLESVRECYCDAVRECYCLMLKWGFWKVGKKIRIFHIVYYYMVLELIVELIDINENRNGEYEWKDRKDW